MKIGVISDTHLPSATEELLRLSKNIFADVSVVLHAGDLVRMSVLDAFFDKKVFAVCGNMDHSDVTGSIPFSDVIEIKGYRIGLIHGWGSPVGLEDRIFSSFENVHVIVYGHSHKVANHIKDGVLMFNPGAFSGTHPFGRNRSVGILTIDDKEGISGEIIQI